MCSIYRLCTAHKFFLRGWLGHDNLQLSCLIATPHPLMPFDALAIIRSRFDTRLAGAAVSGILPNDT